MHINRDNYILDEIPKLNPNGIEYVEFWREQKYKVIYGEWVGGCWIPGILYHYINFWKIEIKDSADSKSSRIGRPFFRDIDYDFCIAYTEARGFSRFEKQTKEDIEGKTPREIMMATYPHSMGKPLFENGAKNIAFLGNRGLGKSFLLSNAIACEYLHEKKGEKKQIVVGAGESKFSTDLLNKFKLGVDNLPGAVEHNNQYYPPPFFKKSKGSLVCGKTLTAEYDVYIGNNKITRGSLSSIKHVSYSDNVFAGQGTRPVLQIYEEAGMFRKLIDCWNNNKETVMYGKQQFGTQIALGTGGSMDKGTVDLSKIFYEPEVFNLVEFEDVWEKKGKIGFFIPVQRGTNDFKDNKGNSKEEEAVEYFLGVRNNLKENNAPRKVIEQEIQYRPFKPSEAFLISSGNIFPQSEIQEHLAYIENNKEIKNSGAVGELFFSESGEVKFRQNQKLREITKYPLDDFDDTKGAVVIWEAPIDNAPNNLYVAGSDPYDHDRSGTGSLGSVFIYKRFHNMESSYETVVAEYTGRPKKAEDFYENTRKLLLFYNARLLYENERKGLHQYFQQKNCTNLLIDQPTEVIKDIIKDSHVDREKGIHMVSRTKDYAERLTNSWLLEEYAPGKMNLKKIRSVALLKELLMYDGERNTDRVIAFFMVMLLLQQMHKTRVKDVEDNSLKNFFDVEIFGGKPDIN